MNVNPSRVRGLCALSAGLLPAVLALAWISAHAQMEMPPAPVVIVTAERQLLAPVTWFPGTVISRTDARLAAAEDGRLIQVADVGTVVSQGDVLARIDDQLLHEQMAEDKAEVVRERARLDYFQGEVARLEKLATGNNVAQNQLDEALADRAVTRSELIAAEARVAQRAEMLRRGVVTAPFSGVVTERLKQIGEWADTGDAVVRLVDPASLEVQAWVPVNALAFIQQGTQLTLNSNPHTATGSVRTIVPIGDDRSKLYELRLSIDTPRWPAGQTLRIAIPNEQPREVVAIPRDALVLRRAGTTVYRVVGDNIADAVSVSVGIAAGDLIEVSGVQPGDQVVTRGGERLQPGQPVAIIPAPDQ